LRYPISARVQFGCGTLANGTPVSSPEDLREALLARPDQFVQALTEKLMTFALGRSLRYQDMPTVRAIVRRAAAEGNTLESLIRGTVDSPAFRMKEVATTPTKTANAPDARR
jgi:hypothetical protein